MAKILCDTTGVTSIPRNVFRKQSSSNPAQNCGSFPNPDLALCIPIDGQWSAWSSWSVSKGCIPVRTRTRKCNKPAPSPCGQPCNGSQRDVKIGGTGGGIFDLTGNNCSPRKPGPILPVPIPTLPRIPRLPDTTFPRFPMLPNIPILNFRQKTFPL